MEQVYGTGFRLKYVTVRGDIQSSPKLTEFRVSWIELGRFIQPSIGQFIG